MFENLNVALYVTGSIAAYKSLMFTRLLVKAGANVRVLMTDGARQFIQPLSFQALAKHDVITTDTDGMHADQITHIELAQWTQLAIMMPADANTIAKVANGLADNEVTTTWLATSAPKVVVPAMNDQMLANPATQRNIDTLKHDGVTLIDPTVGFLAEGYQAKGRMAEPEDVLAQVELMLIKLNPDAPLKHRKILVTAGGTRQPLDPVRFITNSSSGKMGIAIAKAAQRMGADVTLIAADVKIALPLGMRIVRVTTSAELCSTVLKLMPENDGLIMTAAVADFEPITVADHKIKKQQQSGEFTLQFREATDILKAVAKIKRPDQFTVGFAAETNDLKANAAKKLADKGLDLLVANDVSNPKIGFSSDDNQVTFLRPHAAPIQTPVLPKAAIAERLMQLVVDLK
ncbi:bifunctional phosphopantothenoylcysteine decarboxylase/phosphopantothenate--cysteine ligase CoaBC [Nicoliella lavandulae]|uniref:Coenzyme A biosynthesis bifunctional protein CoaBC n=1 Tax=Nicoliella lavandulae TaxID=3082954 RepID=A0ABU8SMV4_9LACO